jgi:hypothetical protein
MIELSVKKVIQNAYQRSQILSYNESITANQQELGLSLLRELIATININGNLISLWSIDIIPLVPGLENIALDGWIDIIQLNFIMSGNIRHQIKILSVEEYYDKAQILNASGLPIYACIQRTVTGMSLNVYLKPNANYPLEIKGYKTLLPNIQDPSFDINATIAGNDSLYTSLLTWQLTQDIFLSSTTNKEPSPFIANKIASLEEKIISIKEYKTKVHMFNASNNSLNDLDEGQQSLNTGFSPN